MKLIHSGTALQDPAQAAPKVSTALLCPAKMVSTDLATLQVLGSVKEVPVLPDLILQTWTLSWKVAKDS